MSYFGKLATRIKKAEKAMAEALERKYPPLTSVRFYIMHGQVNPSRGEVIGYTGGKFAYLRVRLESRTRQVRDVPVWDVISAERSDIVESPQ